MKKLVLVLASIAVLVGLLNGCALYSEDFPPERPDFTPSSVREENEKIAEEAYKEYKNGADYWESVKPNIQEVDSDCVFWVPNGKSYHSTRDCVALLKSKTIYHGPLYEAKEEGKSDPCSKCVGD